MFPLSTLYSFRNCHQSSSNIYAADCFRQGWDVSGKETEEGKEIGEVIKKCYNFISCPVSDLIFKYLASGTHFCYCSSNLLTFSKIIYMYQRNVGLLIVNDSDTKEKPRMLISSSQLKVVNTFRNTVCALADPNTELPLTAASVKAETNKDTQKPKAGIRRQQ